MLLTAGVLSHVACGRIGFDATSGLPDAMSNCDGVPCLLTSISPAIANTGQTISLEGTFDPSGMIVHFPGGANVAANVLGPHHATVAVPPNATAGTLSVTTGNGTLGRLPFRRASFTLGLGQFHNWYEQSAYARATPALVTRRTGARSVTTGNHVYVLGGKDMKDGTTLTSVEIATINADGTLSAFAVAGDLVHPREAFTITVVGPYVYVVGGENGEVADPSVERATIQADGTLGTFALVPGIGLSSARHRHTATIVGNSLYVVGGGDSGTTMAFASVERATIDASGELSTFGPVAGATLTTGRMDHSAAIIGNTLYVVGGGSGLAAGFTNTTTERATINGDGSLTGFEIAPNSSLVGGRLHFTLQLLGGALYAVGGYGSDAQSVEVAPVLADDRLGSFSIVPGVTLNTGRAAYTAVVAGNSFHVIGGQTDSGTPLGDVEHASVNASGGLPSFITSSVSLTDARTKAAIAVAGDWVYVIGGYNTETLRNVDSVERAQVNPDGTLGSFVNAGQLTTSRGACESLVIGGWLYVLGGPSSVERAAIHPDGSLGDFAVVGGVTLSTARSLLATFAAGNFVYAIGGNPSSQTAVTTIDRATIMPNGDLSNFTVAPIALTTPRFSFTTAAIGAWLYVIGGAKTGGGALASVERAAIAGNGSLGSFAPVTGATLQLANIGATSTVIGNELYVISGNTAAIQRAGIAVDSTIAAFIVDAATLPVTLSDAATVVFGNFAWVIGGFDGTRTSAATAQTVLP